MIYLLVVLGVYILHLMLKLNWIITAIVAVYLLAVVPIHKKLYRLYKNQINRFEDTGVYIDTLLYAFVKEGKVIRAFEDVVSTLRDGKMKSVVSEALNHMILTFDDSEILRNSMKIIENEYGCERISTIHRFMCNVEFYGGEIEEPVALLLEDKNRWVSRIDDSIADRKKMFTEIVLSVVASLIICGIILYLPVMNVDISGNWIVQIMSALVIVIDQIIIMSGQKKLTVDWLTLDGMEEEEYYRKKMEEFSNYNGKKDFILSLALTIPVLIVAVLCFVFGKEWAGAGALLVAAICANQHKIGRRLAEKRLAKNISSAFPKWLLDMALLLQSENVHMALRKSMELVPSVLKKELKELIGRLEMDPESAKPYHEFLKSFQLPEVHSAMGMLYGLSIGNSENSGKQISELISRNLEMMDKSDRLRMKDKNSTMYLLFLAPVLTASFKLLTDMAVFLLTFLSTSII